MGQAKRVESENEVIAASKSYLWFVAAASLLKGPYSTPELARLIEKGEISSRYFAWKDGFNEWRPLYGLEEFRESCVNSKKQTTDELYFYPTLSIPGVKPKGTDISPAFQSVRDIPRIKIRLRASHLTSLKKSELIAVFLLSLAMAYGVMLYFREHIEERWNMLWGARITGALASEGETSRTIPLVLTAPMLTARGLKYMDHVYVGVESEDFVKANDALSFRGRQIVDPVPQDDPTRDLSWDRDHVYARRLRVRGVIDLKNPQEIFIERPGYPYQAIKKI